MERWNEHDRLTSKTPGVCSSSSDLCVLMCAVCETFLLFTLMKDISRANLKHKKKNAKQNNYIHEHTIKIGKHAEQKFSHINKIYDVDLVLLPRFGKLWF